jgi:hypothetical protein
VSPAAIAGAIVAVLLAFSRKAPLMTRLWAMLPHPWPVVIPALVALIPQIVDVMKDVSTWGGFALSLFTAFSIAAPGFEAARPKDKDDKGPPSGKPVGPWVDVDAEKTPPSLPGVTRFIAIGWMLLACALLGGCGLFTAQGAKSAQDLAHDLCVLHYGKAKPALSLDDVARTYCKDVDPWLEAIVGAEKLGAAKAAAKAPKR